MSVELAAKCAPIRCAVAWDDVKKMGEEARKRRTYSGAKCDTVEHRFRVNANVLLSAFACDVSRICE